MLQFIVGAYLGFYYMWFGVRTTPMLIKSGWVEWEEPDFTLKMSRRQQMHLALKASWLTATWLVRILPYWRVWIRVW